jgi:hypothetical protein
LIASRFDSAAGFLHADAQGPHSLTYDGLEPPALTTMRKSLRRPCASYLRGLILIINL